MVLNFEVLRVDISLEIYHMKERHAVFIYMHLLSVPIAKKKKIAVKFNNDIAMAY